MTRERYACSVAAIVLIALAVAGCGSAATVADETEKVGTTRSTAELEATYRARLDSARTLYTDADVHFMTGMIVHHAQALVMTALAPTRGARPQVQTLAARIENAQKDEIATMQNWLRDRGQSVPEIRIDGLDIIVTGVDNHDMHHAAGDPKHETDDAHHSDDHDAHQSDDHDAHQSDDHDVHESDDDDEHRSRDHDMQQPDEHGMHDTETGAMHMPGMLTPEQLRELDAARGAEFDRLFLEYMIQHHAGAVTMVEELFSVDGAAQDEAAFKLASDVQVDQITEIERMERMLESLRRPAREP